MTLRICVRQSGASSLGVQAARRERHLHPRHAHPPAVGLPEQDLDIGRDEIDHILSGGLCGRQTCGFAHRALRPFGVAAPEIGEASGYRRSHRSSP